MSSHWSKLKNNHKSYHLNNFDKTPSIHRRALAREGIWTQTLVRFKGKPQVNSKFVKKKKKITFKASSFNRYQNLISPCNINTYNQLGHERKGMITKEKLP